MSLAALWTMGILLSALVDDGAIDSNFFGGVYTRLLLATAGANDCKGSKAAGIPAGTV